MENSEAFYVLFEAQSSDRGVHADATGFKSFIHDDPWTMMNANIME